MDSTKGKKKVKLIVKRFFKLGESSKKQASIGSNPSGQDLTQGIAARESITFASETSMPVDQGANAPGGSPNEVPPVETLSHPARHSDIDTARQEATDGISSGSKNTLSESKVGSTIRNTIKTLLTVAEKASPSFTPLQSVAGGLKAILDVIDVSGKQGMMNHSDQLVLWQLSKANKEKLESMNKQLESIVKLVELHKDFDLDDDLLRSMMDLSR